VAGALVLNTLVALAGDEPGTVPGTGTNCQWRSLHRRRARHGARLSLVALVLAWPVGVPWGQTLCRVVCHRGQEPLARVPEVPDPSGTATSHSSATATTDRSAWWL